MALNVVPVPFVHLRQQYVRNIVNHIVGKEVLTKENYGTVTEMTNGINFFKRNVSSHGFHKELQELSVITDKPHLAFLSPPTSTCIQPDCRLHNVQGKL